jgi:hypothetical protein
MLENSTNSSRTIISSVIIRVIRGQEFFVIWFLGFGILTDSAASTAENNPEESGDHNSAVRIRVEREGNP